MPQGLVAGGPKGKPRIRADAAQVLIRIKERGGRYSLEFSPKRPPTIYFKVPGQPHDLSRKSEVAWAASGLEVGQRIYITAKPNSRFGYMRHESYGPIDSPRLAVPSGTLLRGPEDSRKKRPKRKKLRWKYNVILTNAAGKKLASYDPDVIIDKDP